MKVYLHKRIAKGMGVSASRKVDGTFIGALLGFGLVRGAIKLVCMPFAEWRNGKRVNAILTLVAVLAIASLFVF